MAVSKAKRVLRFPQAKGKTIQLVELSDSYGECEIEIRFEDKTALSFTVEAHVGVLTEFIDWKTGKYKPLKRWRPIRRT
jgi:hypothetical protein